MGTCTRSLQAHAILDSTSHLCILVPGVPLWALIWLCSVLVCGVLPPSPLPHAPLKTPVGGKWSEGPGTAVSSKLEGLPWTWRNPHLLNHSRSLMKPDGACVGGPPTFSCCSGKLLKRTRGPCQGCLMLSKYFKIGYPLLCWQRTTHVKKPIFCLRSLQIYRLMEVWSSKTDERQ